MTTSVQPASSDVYYQAKYWNHYQVPLNYISKNFTGDAKVRWWQYFRDQYALKPFEHALILNCGDGRQERRLYDLGVFKKATAFDISPELLEICNAKKGDRNIKYIQADANTVTFKENSFDLVVNVASLHHIQYLNRMMQLVATCLKPNGYLINFDYIGPHRNQYSLVQWALIHSLNEKLPAHLRNTKLFYPHVPTMIAEDPSEAIHPELLFKYLDRYFHIIERNDTAGGSAYMLITHNDGMRQSDEAKIKKNLERILRWDKQYHQLGWTPPMFSFFIAQPNKTILKNTNQLKKWQAEENERELWAEQHLGTYRWIDYIRVWLNQRKLEKFLFKPIWYMLYFVTKLLIQLLFLLPKYKPVG